MKQMNLVFCGRELGPNIKNFKIVLVMESVLALFVERNQVFASFPLQTSSAAKPASLRLLFIHRGEFANGSLVANRHRAKQKATCRPKAEPDQAPQENLLPAASNCMRAPGPDLPLQFDPLHVPRLPAAIKEGHC